jgi:Chemotaxis protein histidine kinase and related kinases
MDAEFLKGLKETFKIEAMEQLQIIRSLLIAIEEAPDETTRLLESLLRNFHSLKGSSRAVNLIPVEKTCQKVEHELIKVRDSGTKLPHSFVDKMHEYVDALQHVINDFTAEGEKNYDFLLTIFDGFAVETPAEDTREKVSVAAADDSQMSGLFVAPVIGPAGSTIRLPIDRLEGLVQTAEELVYAKLVSDQRYIDCNDLQLIVNQWTRRWQRLRPEIENEAQHRTMAFLRGATTSGASGSLQEFLDMHDSFVGRIQERLNSLEKSVVADRRTVEVLVDSLLDQSRELTMVPFLVMQNLLLKMVRDISKEQGKSISLSITGGEIEIDRHILDEMKDPLIHLIRNCIDHGIEPPEERVELGKPATAEINIRLFSARGGNVEIVVTDDGRGIDPDKVKRSAIEKGILTAEKSGELSYQEALSLIFRSSFSTRGTVSELSGRGLGCTIVKEKVEDLNGSVEVYSKIGLETTFRLSVPVRRQTMVGIAIRLGGRIFVVPTVTIRAAVRAKDQDVRMVEGKRTMIFNGRLVPIISLSDLLHIEAQQAVDDSTALVVGSGEYPIALLVDDVIGEQEVAVKPLPSPLTKIRNIAGATLLKTGDLAVVLNMNEILTSAVLVGTMKTDSIAINKPIARSKPARQKRILVVEDSITSRVLLKNILESAGYIVTVANDGQDGWEKQSGEKFDLIVTDVEMPRMNGFELTKKVRNESVNKDVPIIVVTSLASLDDRRKGVDVGANAYFVKSNFEKTNLLDMVKRLI